jgi:hypothetical protein
MRPGIDVEILATNLRVLAALHPVLDLLTGLPVVVFKGPLATQRAFGHLGARASADNDLWLPGPAAQAALRRLLAAGYSAGSHLDPARMLAARGQVALWPDGDVAQVSVDLHLRPFAQPYFDVADEVLLAHLVQDTSTGRVVETFDLELTFCHAVAHYVQHHFPDAHLDLIVRLWLVCSALRDPASRQQGLANGASLLAADAEMLRLVDETCGRSAAALALHRAAERAGGVPLAPPRERRAREVGRLLSHFHGAPPGLIRKLLALYLTAPRRLVSGIWQSAFPATDVLYERYGVGSRRMLLLRHLIRVLSER